MPVPDAVKVFILKVNVNVNSIKKTGTENWRGYSLCSNKAQPYSPVHVDSFIISRSYLHVLFFRMKDRSFAVACIGVLLLDDAERLLGEEMAQLEP